MTVLAAAAAPCVCVVSAQSQAWIGPVMGAVVGAAIAALVAFVTKGMDYGRHDRSVRTQLIALLKLAATQLASSAGRAANADPGSPVALLDRLVERAFSSDVAIALKIAEAQAVYDAIRDAEIAARRLETALADLRKSRETLLQELPRGESRTPVMERRMAAIAEREKAVAEAAGAGAAALDVARRALGNADPLPNRERDLPSQRA